MELILDSNRNSLLALDLKVCTRLPGACQVTTMIAAHFPPPPQVSIATMGIGVGTLWAGLFGMNVRTLTSKFDHVSEIVKYLYPFPSQLATGMEDSQTAFLGASFIAVVLTLCAALRGIRVYVADSFIYLTSSS